MPFSLKIQEISELKKALFIEIWEQKYTTFLNVIRTTGCELDWLSHPVISVLRALVG
jgi:hypothetical protein